MRPPFFPNEEIELWSYNEDDYDFHGPKTSYTFREKIPGDFQPLSATSSLKEFGKILTDTFKLIVDVGTEIYDTDMIVINDIKYEIVGSVSTWNHVLPHKEVLLKKLRNNSRG